MNYSPFFTLARKTMKRAVKENDADTINVTLDAAELYVESVIRDIPGDDVSDYLERERVRRTSN